MDSERLTKKWTLSGLPWCPVVKNPPSTAGDAGSIPGQGTKIQHTTGWLSLHASTKTRGWCTGMSQRDGRGREEGGGFRMENTCIPVVDSCWYMAKPIQYCKVKKKKDRGIKKTKQNPICSVWVQTTSFDRKGSATVEWLYSPIFYVPEGNS